MSLFIAIFREPTASSVIEEVRSEFNGDTYLLTDYAVLIRCSVDDPRDLSRHFGMVTGKEEEPVPGVVFKLNGSHGGYFSRSLWPWLRENLE